MALVDTGGLASAESAVRACLPPHHTYGRASLALCLWRATAVIHGQQRLRGRISALTPPPQVSAQSWLRRHLSGALHSRGPKRGEPARRHRHASSPRLGHVLGAIKAFSRRTVGSAPCTRQGRMIGRPHPAISLRLLADRKFCLARGKRPWECRPASLRPAGNKIKPPAGDRGQGWAARGLRCVRLQGAEKSQPLWH